MNLAIDIKKKQRKKVTKTKPLEQISIGIVFSLYGFYAGTIVKAFISDGNMLDNAGKLICIIASNFYHKISQTVTSDQLDIRILKQGFSIYREFGKK